MRLDGVDLHAGGRFVYVILREQGRQFLVQGGRGACRWGAASLSDDLERVTRLHARRAAPYLIFNFGVGVKVGSALHDLDVLKSCLKWPSAVVVDQHGSCNAAHVGGHALGNGFRQIMLQGDITQSDPATWL